MKLASLIACIIFAIVALAHLLRLVLQIEVVIGGVTIPLWVSIFGIIGPSILSVLLYRESHRPGAVP
jgi:hypothetical protein